MSWARTTVRTPRGTVQAVAPEILSASRATDVPAFFSEWFVERLRAGFVESVNPFNGRGQTISFERAKVVVLWSKNPRPLLADLDEIDRHGLTSYLQFTLNDYEGTGLEPGLPPLHQRIATFRSFSRRMGRERVIWRFDPLLLTEQITVDKLVSRIRQVGDQIATDTTRLVFSFADLNRYRAVRSRLARIDRGVRELTVPEALEAAERIAALCRAWELPAYTCAETLDLSGYGIEHGRCIDGDLILRITGNDPVLLRRLEREGRAHEPLLGGTSSPHRRKDPGQRTACGCAPSKDIGRYGTCRHGCGYCYAMASRRRGL